jgi:hypothetical protein
MKAKLQVRNVPPPDSNEKIAVIFWTIFNLCDGESAELGMIDCIYSG